MNALVAIRSNATGLFSPTPEQRASVEQTLQATAASRKGELSVQETATRSTSSVTGVTTTSESVTDELGKDAFLQLLVLQMQNQNPLEPIDNSDMLAQLAQFSALEALTNLNKSFEALNGNIDQLNFISASSLLGRTVTGIDLNGELRTGVIEAVHLDGSNVVLTVDGEFMYVAGIISIEAEPVDETDPEGDPPEAEEDETDDNIHPEV